MRKIDKKEVGKIYETRDYDAFSFLHFNRNAKPRKDLLDALEKYGKFFEPIIVNEDLEVLDGQHRLLSAKFKGVPINFYIVDDVTAKQVIKSVNTERKNWSVREYVDFYARLGDENYKVLKEHLESDLSSQLLDSVIQEVLAGAAGQAKKVRKGTYTIDRTNQPKQTFDFMVRVMKHHKGKMSSRVSRGILMILPKSGIHEGRLYNVLKDEEVYETAKGLMGEARTVDYIMSEYNKGLTTNYVEYYFDKRGSFQVIK